MTGLNTERMPRGAVLLEFLNGTSALAETDRHFDQKTLRILPSTEKLLIEHAKLMLKLRFQTKYS